MTDSLVPVRIGVCLCPGTPHADGDFIYLRPKLDLRGGFRVKRRLLDLNQAAFAEGGPSPDMAELEIQLAEAYLSEGIAAWNLVDAEGVGREVTPDSLREFLFYDYSRSELAADKADDLYRPAVLDPLVARALSSLPATPTNGLTSRPNGHGPKRRRPSKPSSTAPTPMGGTEATT